MFVALLLAIGAFSPIESYFKRHTSQSKLTRVAYRGEWSIGEYRECDSANSQNAQLNCGDFASMGSEKIFNVEFFGDEPYDQDKPNDVSHRWLCRRNNDDPTFSCQAKETPQTPSSNVTDRPPPVERHLSPEDLEYFRKRNECENRFYDKKIFEVDGMSIGRACKQNPDRRP